MLMTEDDAKTKWCPQVRTDGIAANRDGANPSKGSMCFASGCMMWRAPILNRTYDCNTTETINVKHDRVGYCGLAGIPQ